MPIHKERAQIAIPAPTALQPLKRPLNLRETVLEQLRTAIITGNIAEGTMVSAPALGQELGVSATPVREAMMDLAREGLVETVKNKGFRITRMTDKDLDDLAAVRLLLEPPAIHAVIGKIDSAGFDNLTAIADECLEAAEAEDLPKYLRCDREFHRLLLSYGGNQQLTELATQLRLRTRLYGLQVLARSGRLGASAREHQHIIALLRAGDGQAAEQLLRAHIGHARNVWATGS